MSGEFEAKILQKLPHWKIIDGKLQRSFDLGDFVGAFGFMTQIAIVAEKMNHHPEWSNVYKTVVIDLITHSKGCITQLDIDLAGKIDDIFNNTTH